jgi:hypothetical protein
MRALPSPAIGGQFGPIVPSVVAPSPRPHRDLPLALALCGAALGAGCGLSDVFATPGAGAVVFVWEGDSVLGGGQVVPIRITVLADGEPLPAPRLLVTVPVSDTDIIALDTSGDSIVAKRSGSGDVMVELLSSLTTGVPPDTVFTIRVTGAPPP